MPRPRYAIIEAPSILGLSPSGVETLPRALLDAGLADRLGARHAGRVEPPAFDPAIDPATKMLNPRGIADYSVALADAIGSVLEAGEVPLVLGGDCTILLGCTLATRRRGRAGLLFVDGHADFFQPAAEPKGEGASMDLAFVTGRGPAIVTDLEGRRPLVRDEDVVLLGRRDLKDAQDAGSQRVERTVIDMMDLAAVRQIGVEASMDSALERLTADGLDGFWLHLDVDVLHDDIMPAGDYRMPDGLQWDEFVAVLRRAVGSGRVLGVNVTIFNPTLDPDGSVRRNLVDALADGLAG